MKKGFSLVELLVVIAIIAILAAIAFPVFTRAKDSAYRGADMSNMNSIRTAMSLYRNDQGAYPPALLGYADTYDGTMTNVIPANELVAALYPKRIDSLATLRPAYVRPLSQKLELEIGTAIWPGQMSPPAGEDFPKRFQKYGPNDGNVKRCVINPTNPSDRTVVDNYYYRISGYDAAQVPNPANATAKRNELRYTRFWTGYTVPDDPCYPQLEETGSMADDPRQLGYTDPPDSTVITWDSYFRDYDATGTTPTRDKRDLVLFLGGSARAYDSQEIYLKSWKVTP